MLSQDFAKMGHFRAFLGTFSKKSEVVLSQCFTKLFLLLIWKANGEFLGVLETILSNFRQNIAFFEILAIFSTFFRFFLNANGASKVCGVEDIGLVDNHGHFGGEPQSILAKIETESGKIKIFVFF